MQGPPWRNASQNAKMVNVSKTTEYRKVSLAERSLAVNSKDYTQFLDLSIRHDGFYDEVYS